MPHDKTHDAFLSHNSNDKASIEQIARWLEDEKQITVWLDKWNLIPGDPWQEKIERALDESQCCVVFFGPNGVGPWQHEEMRDAIHKRVSNNSIRVLPVILPGVKKNQKDQDIPVSLQRITWVEFKKSIDDEDDLHNLYCGIMKIRPGRRSETSKFFGICPFRGLEIFSEQYHPFFFGRDDVVQQLTGHLASNRFLAVIGPSGSGKSSVIQAGVLPLLKNSFDEEHIDYTIFTPRNRPIEELTFAIQRLKCAQHLHFSSTDIIRLLSEDERSLYHIIREIGEKASLKRIILIVDQFEELFTLSAQQHEQQQFLNLLVSALETGYPPLRIIITLRSDFIEKCLLNKYFNTYIQNNITQIGPLEQEELLMAIQEPATMTGLTFENGLVTRIMQDSSGAPGELPLIEHALLELFNRREGNLLTNNAYNSIGGIEGALTNRAETEFNNLKPSEQDILKKMFLLRLVKPGEGTEATRRRATKEELLAIGGNAEIAEKVIQAWTNARLLTTATDPQKGIDIVDVAHEALIRKWPKVHEWLELEHQNIRIREKISQRSIEWKQNTCDDDFLFKGVEQNNAEEFLKTYRGDLLPDESAFIVAGEKFRTQQSRRKRKLSYGISFILILGMATFSIFAINWRKASNKATSQLVANYWENGRQARTENNRLLGLHSIACALTSNKDKNTTTPISMDLNDLMSDAGLINIFSHNGPVTGAILTKDQKKVLSWSEDSTLRFWDIVSGDQIGVSMKHNGPVIHAVFSHDQQKILSWSTDSTARIWDARSTTQIGQSFKHNAQLSQVLFNQDERRIVTWSTDSIIHIWDIESLTELKKIEITGSRTTHNAALILIWGRDGDLNLWVDHSDTLISIKTNQIEKINGANFSPGSNFTIWGDQTVNVFNLDSTRVKIKCSFTCNEPIVGATFINNDENLITWGDNSVQCWDLKIGTLIYQTPNDAMGRRYPVLTKDGKYILTLGTFDATVIDTKTGGKQFSTELGLSTPTTLFACFNTIGNRVMIKPTGDAIQLWKLSNVAPSHNNTGQNHFILNHDSPIQKGGFNSKGDELITFNNSIYIWNVETGKQVGFILPHNGPINGVSFSEDESKILSWSADNTVRLWKTPTDEYTDVKSFDDKGAFNYNGAFNYKFKKFGNDYYTWRHHNDTLQIIDVKKKMPLCSSIRMTAHPDGLKISPDKSRIITWCKDSTISIWKCADGANIGPIHKMEGQVSDAAFNIQGDKIVTCISDKKAQLWNSISGEIIENNLPHIAWKGHCPVFSHDGYLFLTWGVDSTVIIRSIKDRHFKNKLYLKSNVQDVLFTKNDLNILTWSNDSTVRIWDVKSCIEKGQAIKTDDFILGIYLLHGEKKLLIQTNNFFEVWDLGSRQRDFHVGTKRYNLIISPDENKIVTIEEKQVCLWNSTTGAQIGPAIHYNINVFNGPVFMNSGNQFLTMDEYNKEDGESGASPIRFWDVISGKQLGPDITIGSNVRDKTFVFSDAFFSDDQKQVYALYRGYLVNFYIPGDLDFPPDKFILQVEALTGTRFDPETRQISTLPLDELKSSRQKYFEVAKKHAEECNFKNQNIYLQLHAQVHK